jgi:hypothetical protein
MSDIGVVPHRSNRRIVRCGCRLRDVGQNLWCRSDWREAVQSGRVHRRGQTSSRRQSRSQARFDYNFCRIHKTLRITPAMAAGVTDHVWTRSAPHELQRSAMSRQSEGMRVDGFAGKRWRRQGIVCRVRPPVARACPAKGRYGAQSAQDAKFKLRHYRYWGARPDIAWAWVDVA